MENKEYPYFSSWSIEELLYNFISDNLEEGKILLEFGSGSATEELVKKWNVYSVEEAEEWYGEYHNQYIFAPIENQEYDDNYGWKGWYNLEILKNNLPKKADLILVDGPCHGDRNGIFDNKDLILKLGAKIWVFDDLERSKDLRSYNNFIRYFKQNNIKIESDIIISNKHFGYIKIK